MDMLVNLYRLKDLNLRYEKAAQEGIRILRAMTGDAALVQKFVLQEFPDSPSWADECAVSLNRQPVSCYLAVYENRIIGFSCYDATARGMVGPIGMAEEFRGRGIASVLVDSCLQAMREIGYAYAVIGWVSSPEFYKKICNAVEIADSEPGVYRRKVELVSFPNDETES